MSDLQTGPPPATAPPSTPSGTTTEPAPAEPARPWTRHLAFSNIGAVYVLIALVALFAIWVPQTFLTSATLYQVFNSTAVTALAALSVIIPLSARVFDLSIAGTITLTGVVATQLIVKHELGVPAAVAVAVLTGLMIGVLNAIIVVVLKIDSFIATMASGALLAAFTTMVTGDLDVTGVVLSQGFNEIGQTMVGGFTLPVVYVVVVTAVLWFLMQHTAFGRRMYATGFNREAARLAGVPTERLRFASLVISGGLAGLAGIVLAATLAAGSVTAGTPYLLGAFAAAFLGATQLQHGRFNAVGTIIAVLLLGTGVVGLGLAQAPTWSQDLFTGLVLIVALIATRYQRAGAANATVGH
ncbi:ABC transporter permease [Nocardioides zeae]|uniref:ABC transporter permease n=1 Tax=Nocardioides imazamoxiresistens TaxID=3231893 RepID=A0ABU3PRZ7_9ACTN|nr:ABC transporter permease [Nocardioides zeae]MDT9591666.1 ABC transporter permease [Nocardioides zeae]